MQIPRTSKLHRKTYVETTWIFWPSKLLWKTVRGNNVDFSTTEITSKKVHGNNMDFSTSKIKSKKVRGNYVEIRWNLVFEVLRDIDVELTWIRRGGPVRKAYSEPCHRALFSHIQAYSEACATLAYAGIPQWTFWYCNDTRVKSPSISLWLCWYIVNETNTWRCQFAISIRHQDLEIEPIRL